MTWSELLFGRRWTPSDAGRALGAKARQDHHARVLTVAAKLRADFDAGKRLTMPDSPALLRKRRVGA